MKPATLASLILILPLTAALAVSATDSGSVAYQSPPLSEATPTKVQLPAVMPFCDQLCRPAGGER